MLHSLSLENVRSWVDRSTLRLGQLTLLAGPNNAGKSSFLGGLQALIQSEQAHSKDELLLSGDWVDLGSFDQLLSASARTAEFSIGLTGSTGQAVLDVVWTFQAPAQRDREAARVQRIEAQVGDALHVFEAAARGMTVSVDGVEPVAAILPAPASFLATSGARTGEVVPLLPYQPEQVHSVGPYRAPPERGAYMRRRGEGGPAVGRYGEYAAQLAWNQGSKEVDVLPPDGGLPTDRFDRAINRWYSFALAQRVNLRVEEIPRFGHKVLIEAEGVEDLSFSQVGFGLSQAWPIVVAALSSRRGDLVLVDTPEAHLHPSAQHRLARLFVELARCGRQVIVETHSEHVLAAVCQGIKDEALVPSDVAVQHVRQDGGISEVEEVLLDRQGRRLSAPQGFFDQSLAELLELLK